MIGGKLSRFSIFFFTLSILFSNMSIFRIMLCDYRLEIMATKVNGDGECDKEKRQRHRLVRVWVLLVLNLQSVDKCCGLVRQDFDGQNMTKSGRESG